MASLADITLIMPTYNRADYAVRTMMYWSGCPVTVHVVDGSRNAIPAETLKSLAGNVTYHHMPVSIYDRLAFAVSLVKTDYCALIEDDSFLLKDGLEACLRELDNNPQLSSCMGRCIAFKVEDGEACGELQFREFKDHNIEHPDPLVRIQDHLHSFTPTTVYSLMRAEAWKHAMAMLADKVYLPATMGELPFEICAVYRGSARVLPHLFWFRSIENDGHPVEGGPNPLAHWWPAAADDAVKDKLLGDLSTSLQPTQPVSEVKCALRNALDAYCAYSNTLEINLVPSSGLQVMLVQIRRKVFGWLPRALKDRVLKFFWASHYKPYRPLRSVAQELALENVKFDKANLDDIIERIAAVHSLRRSRSASL